MWTRYLFWAEFISFCWFDIIKVWFWKEKDILKFELVLIIAKPLEVEGNDTFDIFNIFLNMKEQSLKTRRP